MIKRRVNRPDHSQLVDFVPDSTGLYLSLLFCPLASAGATLCTCFPLNRMLNISCIWCLPLQDSSPYGSSFANQKEGHRATELPESITGLPMPAYDCL